MSGPTTGAALLLEAAALMRGRAEKATPGVWKLWGMTVESDQYGTSDHDTAVSVADTYGQVDGHLRTFDAAHIASWHPAVALDAAALLEVTAANYRHLGGVSGCEQRDRARKPNARGECPTCRADALARRYLGRES